MLSTTTLFTFLVASISLTLMPGPDNIFVLTESVTRGAKYGIQISLGLVTGLILHTFIAVSGLALFLKTSPLAFIFIKILGALYLIYLAYLEYTSDPSLTLSKNNEIHDQQLNPYMKGLIMNILNPKVSLFFLAFLPGFVEDQTKFTTQIMMLGGIFFIQALLIFIGLSLTAQMLLTIIKSPKKISKIRVIKIIILVLLSVIILFF